MSAFAEKAGPKSTRYSGWVLSVMDVETAEPIAGATEPFTRLGRSILEARGRALAHMGVEWRVDPIKADA